MGKPSSYKTPKKSIHQMNVMSSIQRIQSPMSSHSMEKRKKHNKTRNRIKNLFNKLKRKSKIFSTPSSNSSGISLETVERSNDTQVVVTDLTKRSASPPTEAVKRKRLDSVIFVDDDSKGTNITSQSSPKRYKTNIDCSTPICKSDHGMIQQMIVTSFLNPNNSNDTQNFNADILNLTKEINGESYLTIDLTCEGDTNKTAPTVIDLDDSANQTEKICNHTSTLRSPSHSNLSLSGESDVTVLHNDPKTKEKQITKFAKGISQLNSSEKGKLLDLIVKNVFNGCQIVDKKNISTNPYVSQGTETGQDMFIKEVILGETKSRNSIGSNIYHPSKDQKNKRGLRMIIIDGSNVAMEHTKGAYFSVKGLKICIDYFVRRGHVVKAFVPRFRCKYGKSSDPKLLDSLERQGLVVYTPSREIKGRICVSYDDRYIVQCAAEFDGVIVSGDNYRDLIQENPRWGFVIENRILPFTWVDDMIMFPKDPLGRKGPTLSEFLRHPATLPVTNMKSQYEPAIHL